MPTSCLIQDAASFIEKVLLLKKKKKTGFPSGSVVKNPPANAGDMGSTPGPGGSHMPRGN